MKKTILIMLGAIFFVLPIFTLIIHGETKSYTIVIDAGHGGYDGGALGKHAKEKEINLAIALKLRAYLDKVGISTIMIRENDESFAPDSHGNKKRTDLNYRVQLINEANADLFVSIHMNAMPDSRWHGAQTFYHPKDSRNQALAKAIQTSLKTVLKNTTREEKPIQTLYLLKQANIPGVLIECGFLSNEKEEQLLLSPAYQDQVAYAIFLGILDYLNENDEN